MSPYCLSGKYASSSSEAQPYENPSSLSTWPAVSVISSRCASIQALVFPASGSSLSSGVIFSSIYARTLSRTLSFTAWSSSLSLLARTWNRKTSLASVSWVLLIFASTHSILRSTKIPVSNAAIQTPSISQITCRIL